MKGLKRILCVACFALFMAETAHAESIGELNYRKCAGDAVVSDLSRNKFGQRLYKRDPNALTRNLILSSKKYAQRHFEDEREDIQTEKKAIAMFRKAGARSGDPNLDLYQSTLEYHEIRYKYFECLLRQPWPASTRTQSASRPSTGLRCLTVTPERGDGVINYRIANNCSETMNVSICTRLAGEALEPNPDYARVPAGDTGRGGVFNPKNVRYKFLYRFCPAKNVSGKIANCRTQCPPAFGQAAIRNPFAPQNSHPVQNQRGGYSANNPFVNK